MDKKTQKLLLDAEGQALLAEGTMPIDDAASLAKAIAQAFETNRQIDLLTKARTAKNASYQKKVREHTAWFKPMLDRLALSKKRLRAEVDLHLNPTGDMGNKNPEEVRAYGTEGVGTATYADIPVYEYDLQLLAELNPQLLSVDETAVKKLIADGNLPQGVTPKRGFQLRIA